MQFMLVHTEEDLGPLQCYFKKTETVKKSAKMEKEHCVDKFLQTNAVKILY